MLIILNKNTVIVIALGSFTNGSLVAAQDVLTTLTARETSLYYQAATALNNVVKPDGFTLDIKESAGSFGNLEELGKGNADLAFAQQDAFELLSKLSDPEQAKLASNIKVFAPVSNEIIHVIVNKSAKIKNLADLKGKSVAIGPEGSGTYVSAILLYQLLDIDITRESLSPLEIEVALQKLKAGEIDAAFYTAGMGAPLLKKMPAADSAKLQLLSVNPKAVENIKRVFRDDDQVLYVSKQIPAKTYPWQPQAVDVVSTFSFVYVNSALDSQKIYKLAKSAYPQAPKLKAQDQFWLPFGIKEAKSQLFRGVDYHPGVKQFLDEQK
jgi:uncharacterized protein